MNAQRHAFPLDLKELIRGYTYNDEKFAAFEHHILNKIYDYDEEYGPQLLRHLQVVSRNLKGFMLSEGYSKSDTHKVSMAYLLHDAGKILQDVSIWKFKEIKSDRSPEENAQRPMHGKLGLQVITDASHTLGIEWDQDDKRHLELISYLMVTHHERLNGSGPAGFKDAELDDILRMATIVDAIDGKTKIKSMSKIFEDMTGSKHEGQFDLTLVNRYIAFLEKADLHPAQQASLAKTPNP